MTEIAEALERVTLTDELSVPTKVRPEFKEQKEEIFSDPSPFGPSDDFSPEPEPILSDPDDEEIEQDEDGEEFDPEESADSAINILDIIQTSISLPIATSKLRKKYGGKDKVKEFSHAFDKKEAGEKLSENEEKMAQAYASYKKRLKEIKEVIPFTEDDIQLLKPSTIKYCEKHGIKLNEGLGLGMAITKVLSDRVIEIIML